MWGEMTTREGDGVEQFHQQVIYTHNNTCRIWSGDFDSRLSSGIANSVRSEFSIDLHMAVVISSYMAFITLRFYPSGPANECHR
jgi:hypothetical protein